MAIDRFVEFSPCQDGGIAAFLFLRDGIPIAAIPVETYRLAVSPTLAAIPLGFLIGRGLGAFMVAGFQTELYRIPLIVEPGTYAFAAIVVLTRRPSRHRVAGAPMNPPTAARPDGEVHPRRACGGRPLRGMRDQSSSSRNERIAPATMSGCSTWG